MTNNTTIWLNASLVLIDANEKDKGKKKMFTDMLDKEKTRLAQEKWKQVQMNRLNTKVGLMFASKPIVQLIANPFIGPLTNKYAR